MAKKRFQDSELWLEIDLELCTGARECVDVCPKDCYEIIEGKATADNIGMCIESAAWMESVQTMQSFPIVLGELLHLSFIGLSYPQTFF